ncbi:hypothetical protein Btru_002859 [Bulinus truncatus]|nr:hypothetical protein Btru_002859 [Bulinus truncatus]
MKSAFKGTKVELKNTLSAHFHVANSVGIDQKTMNHQLEIKKAPLKWAERARKFTCQFCQKTFVVRRDWEGHINSMHLKAKPFRCDACSWSSSHRGELQKHLKKCSVNCAFFANLGSNLSIVKSISPHKID